MTQGIFFLVILAQRKRVNILSRWCREDIIALVVKQFRVVELLYCWLIKTYKLVAIWTAVEQVMSTRNSLEKYQLLVGFLTLIV